MKLFDPPDRGTTCNNVLTVGGRYVCGNPNSLMPVWSTASNAAARSTTSRSRTSSSSSGRPTTQTYRIRDPETDRTGRSTRSPARSRRSPAGWTRPTAGPETATPFPACWRTRPRRRHPAPVAPQRRRWRRRGVVLNEQAVSINFVVTSLDGAGRRGVPDRVRQPGHGDPPQRPDRRSRRQDWCSRGTRSTAQSRSPTTSRPSRPRPTRSSARGIRT